MDDSLNTVVIVVLTFVIAFVVAKVAPALQPEEKKCPPPQQYSFWRLLRGTMLIRREQVTEELFEEISPPKGK